MGAATSRLIAQNFESWTHFEEEMAAGKSEKLLSIDGIGESMAHDIVEFFKEEHNILTIRRLREEITIEDFNEKIDADSPLAGKPSSLPAHSTN